MKKLILAGIIVAMCVACGGSSVDKSISKVNKALEKVEKNKGKMTEDDWQSLNKELEEPMKILAEAIDSDKVGVIKKVKIVAATTKWMAVFAEAGIRELEKSTGVDRENFGKELEKAAKELENNSGDLQKELEKAAKELEQNKSIDVESIAKELEKAAKELEKIAADKK